MFKYLPTYTLPSSVMPTRLANISQKMPILVGRLVDFWFWEILVEYFSSAGNIF